ncbi:DUF4360 domain-containing protein [Spirillospora sp. NBC_00431]
MRKGRVVPAAVVAALAMAATSITPATAGPRPVRGPGELIVEIASIKGSGCAAGSVSVAVTDDAEAFAVTYNDYMAQAGGSSKPTDARRNCQLVLKLHVPRSWTYAFSSTDLRGYALLGRGVKGLHKEGHSLQGHSDTWMIPYEVNGPYDGNWSFTDSAPGDQLVFKRCGEDGGVNIHTELRVYKRSANQPEVSFMTMGSVDNSLSTTYRMAWKRCP